MSTTGENASKSSLSVSDSESLVYRCVCSELLTLSGEEKTTCTGCGRSYDSALFRGEDGEETVMATLCERRTRVIAVPGEADPMIGQRWGHYRIIEVLGEGGMGAVYRALDESLQRYVALKIIRGGEGKTDDSKQMERLFQEARAQARVSHPNVVHIYFIDQHEGSPFFAMELVNGPTLKDRLEKGPLAFLEVVQIGLQLAKALRHALAFDTVHGDIKPSNILQTDTNEVKLSDFGLARRMSELKEGEGTLAGTPNYLSPESAARKSTDFRSDLYSLGVTLFELTFGKLPYSFGTQSVEERLKAHQFRPVEFPEIWPEHVPPMWRDVLERLMAKDQELRYQSYDGLIADLEAARPASLPASGIVPRVLAWWIDMMLLFLITAAVGLVFELPLISGLMDRLSFLEGFAKVGALSAAAATFIILQRAWGNTPGKNLFHLRVVDVHGATPSPSLSAARMGMQYWLLWGGGFFEALDDFGLGVPEFVIGLFVIVPFLVEIALLPFGRKRLSLHDRLFRTRVVLDVRDSSDS